jgi:hypothetical protein
MRTLAIAVTAVLVFIGACALMTQYSATSHSCVRCRATFYQSKFFNAKFEKIATNPYAESVMARFPNHQHVWGWCGTMEDGAFFLAKPACGERHRIWTLPMETQAEYEKLVANEEMERQLKAISSKDREKADAAVAHIFEVVFDAQHAKQGAAANP